LKTELHWHNFSEMGRCLPLSATQTALLAASGGPVSALGFLTLYLAPGKGHHHSWSFFAILAMGLGLVVCGYVISFKAEESLASGIANERWNGQDVESIRAKLSGSLFTVSIGLLLGAGLCVLVAQMFRNWHSQPLAWVFLVLVQGLTRLRSAALPPRASSSGPTWTTLAPIRSDHWGER
jgi:MFS family permease